MGFLHIWLCLHFWICSFSSSALILLIPTRYSGKFSNSVLMRNNMFWSWWIRGLVASLVDPQLSCRKDRLCTSAHSFLATHSTGLHHSLLRHPFPGWILKSSFLGHSSLGRGFVSMTILVLLLWISLIVILFCEQADRVDVWGEPWINKCHDKILCIVFYLLLRNIHCLFYLFHCCLTLLLHFHGTTHQNYKILLITVRPVFHMGS